MKREKRKAIVIILLEIIGILILYCFCNSAYITYLPSCWIYESTGIWCPACGGTRCVQNIMKGNLWEAFLANSVFFILIEYLFFINIVFLWQLYSGKKDLKKYYPTTKIVFLFVLILLVYTIWRNLL